MFGLCSSVETCNIVILDREQDVNTQIILEVVKRKIQIAHGHTFGYSSPMVPQSIQCGLVIVKSFSLSLFKIDPIIQPPLLSPSPYNPTLQASLPSSCNTLV